MAVTISKYVEITSGVGGGARVRQRDLIGRIYTSNVRVPVDSIVELTSADDASTYFGSTSEEYRRAAFYFSWVSKIITAPQALQFVRWAETDQEPRIFGARVTVPLATLQAITAGTLRLTAGDNTVNVTGLNFAAASSFAAVAAALQTAIRTQTGTQFPAAVVTYDAPTGTFNLTGSVAETAPIAVTLTGGLDVAPLIGWGTSAVFSPGVDTTSITDTLVTSIDTSTNFGSFLFLSALSQEEVIEAAQWNATRNVEFMLCLRCDDTNRDSLSAALINIPGQQLTYAPLANEYDEMCPMIIMAATPYARRNSVQNYMYQQFTLTPKVTTTLLSDELDGLRINYYGVTQTAGQLIAFYQRGVMGGGATAPVDQNVYANEIWFKDVARANILSLLLSVGRVPANAAGNGQVITILQDAIDQALFNGTISVDKPLTAVQKLYIGNNTGDELAWHQVQNIGYWLDAVVQSYVTTDSRTEYKIVYTLIYSKDDAVRKVEGSHILI